MTSIKIHLDPLARGARAWLIVLFSERVAAVDDVCRILLTTTRNNNGRSHKVSVGK